MKASVVIPTKSPGPGFREVLDRVLAQDCPWPFEVIVVDSGSGDGTVDFVRSRPQARLVEIPPQEFGHGRTRNHAAGLAQGEFVAFLTHDALPVDEHWLARMVAALEQAPEIAGAFGRHIAYPDATPFTKRDLENHFQGFLAHPLVVSKATDPDRYAADQGWRQFLHFYSDNNSCFRKSVWEQIPYPDVEFAEDQIWAHRIIEAGYAKAYVPDAVVYHSHDYGTYERFQRAFDESNAFRVLFGYRLCGTPYQAMRSMAWIVKRDVSYARQQGIGIGATIRQMLQGIALVAGHMAGSHAHRLPARIRLRLSRDKRLQRSLPATGAA